MPGADVGVSLACRQIFSLPNVYCELTVPPCASVEESLDNARLDVATMIAVLTKRRRNSGCAATALPPELLSYVFSMNVLSDRPQLKKGSNCLGWVSATHVCRRWREIALATPTLWRHLDLTCMSRRWCSELLGRSGNCSLEVAVRIAGYPGQPPSPTSLDATRELARPEYLSRLTGLHLDLSSRTKPHVDSLILSLRQSAPRLEYLAIRRTSWERVTISSLTSRLPSLRRLKLTNIFLSPWISPIFTSLQELDISFDSRPYDSAPSYSEMSTILCCMPELRRLSLRSVLPQGTSADVKLNEHISLPNLRYLSLIDQQGCDFFSFVASLYLPPETCAEIETNGRACVDTLLPQYELAFGPVRRLKLLVNQYPQISLEFRASDALTVERSAPAQLRLAYSLLSSPPPSPPHAAASSPPTRIAHHFSAARLRLDGLLYLDITSHVPWSADSWRALFTHATQLRQVRATYRGAVDGLILQVFLAASGEQPLFFPNLYSVKLCLVDLDEVVDAVDPPRARGDLLLDGLARRRGLSLQGQGSEIRELEVPDYGGGWIAKLREIVPGALHAEVDSVVDTVRSARMTPHMP